MFDNSDRTNASISELVSKICKLASCTEERASASDREQALHSALQAAYRLEHAMSKQDEKIAYLDRLAMTDSLTGILNRRGFQSEMQRVLASARRFNETGVLLYIDLNDFKAINDNWGHACGDEALCLVARLLERSTRGMDYIARLGGDEFAVLLVRTDWQSGMERVEQISRNLNEAHFNWRGQTVQIQASIGIQRYDHESRTHDLLNAADKSMYAIKKLKDEVKTRTCTLSAAE